MHLKQDVFIRSNADCQLQIYNRGLSKSRFTGKYEKENNGIYNSTSNLDLIHTLQTFCYNNA